MAAETNAEKIARLTAELVELRAARSAQLTGGAKKQTGVFRMEEIDFSALVAEIKRKETELAAAEAIEAGRGLALPQFRTRGH